MRRSSLNEQPGRGSQPMRLIRLLASALLILVAVAAALAADLFSSWEWTPLLNADVMVMLRRRCDSATCATYHLAWRQQRVHVTGSQMPRATT